MPDAALARYFALFNEIGIINQLASTMFEARLPKGVTVGHFSVLNHLIRVKDGRTPMEIAQAFQVPKTTASHWIAALSRRGWVEVRPNPADKRSKTVWLTEAGRAFREEAIAALEPELRPLTGVIPAYNIGGLVQQLEELRRYLDAAREPDPRAMMRPVSPPPPGRWG